MIPRMRGALLLLLCLLALGALPASAQDDDAELTQPDITLEVQAGYDGLFRTALWYPVNVVISNDGPDVRGVLQVYHGNTDTAPFQQAIDLPRGARKQVQLYGIAYGFNRIANVSLLVDGQPLVRERVQLEPTSNDTFLIGVVGTDRTLLNSLSAMPIDNTLINVNSIRLVHIPPELLPDRFNAIEGLDMLVIHDAPATIWTAARVQQLDLWVHMGGQLVVSGGLAGEPSLAPLRDLLPATVGDLTADRPVQPLRDLVPDQPPPAERTLSAYQVALRDTATSLDSDALISQWQRGSGRVTLLAFDPAALRGWVGEPALWSQIATVLPRLLPGSSLRWNDNNLLDTTLQLPELRLPPVFLLLLYIAVYVLAIGPMNFLILRRMRRADLAWITIPLTVLVFVLGTYSASLLLRGVRPQLLQVNVVQSFEGFDTAHVTANVGIFSPRRERYTLVLPPQSLATSERFNLTFEEATIPLLWTDQESRFEQALVDVSSLRTFLVEQSGPLAPSIASALERSSDTTPYSQNQLVASGNQPAPPGDALRGNLPDEVAITISGSIENRGTIALDEALLVYGNSVEALGTLAPGDRIEVRITAEQSTFPLQDSISDVASAEGLFNRLKIINAIFAVGDIGASPPVVNINNWTTTDPHAVYLLGWSDQPVLPLELRGTSAQPGVTTLYIVQLAVAP